MHDDEYPLSFLVPNGLLFILSHDNGSAQYLNTQTQKWSSMPAMPMLNGSAIQYRPGKILLTGGGNSGGNSVSDSAIIDLNSANPTWQKVAPMYNKRYFHSLVMLPNGNVLATAGIDKVNIGVSSGPLAIEMWDPDTQIWTSLAPMAISRVYHETALLLPDGKIIQGGPGKTSQLYSPPYLFAGARPEIAAAPTETQYGASLTIQTPDSARIGKVTLISLGAATHTTNSNQHYSELPFTNQGNFLTVQSPTNPNIAPPGYYMLFIVDTNGIPSQAKMIKIDDVVITPTPFPSPTSIPTPTMKPTPILIASPTLTPTSVPTIALTPTSTPFITATPKPTIAPPPNDTQLAITLLLHGLGTGGDNAFPGSTGNFTLLHPQRTITVDLYNEQSQLVVHKQGSIQFNTNTGSFLGNVDIGSAINSGSYTIKVGVTQFLTTQVPGIHTLTAGKLNILPTTSLINGDINDDNRVSILDYNLLMNCYSDLTQAKNCTGEQKTMSDLNDDGKVNAIDYNIFIRELSIIRGE